MTTSTAIIDVNELNLQQVLEQSIQQPVLFYFWSQQNPHCQELTQTLERIAQQHAGNFLLAKVDCDQQQILASQFGLRAIPTVYLFQNGQPVDGFQGPQSAEVIQNLLEKVLPREDEVKLRQAEQLLAEQKPQEALPLLKDAWQISEQASEVGLVLADALLRLNRSDEAETVLQTIPTQAQDSRYQSLIAQIDLLKQAAESPEIQQLQAKAAAEPENSELAIQLAIQWQQVGRTQEALDLLLSFLQKDLAAGEGKIRQTFQEILTALGSGDALASCYRRKLYSLLY